MSEPEITATLQTFVDSALGSNLTPDADIFDAGATSLFAIELVMFIEQTFDVELGDDDLTRDNFTSVAAMTRLVQQRRARPR